MPKDNLPVQTYIGWQVVLGYPRGDSNARARLRRPPLYPLSYGGRYAPILAHHSPFGKNRRASTSPIDRREG